MGTALKLCGLLLIASGSTQAWADGHGGLGAWEGTGAYFEPDGRPAGQFKIELTRSSVDARTVELRGTVTLATGKILPLHQTTTTHENGFSLATDEGKGSGLCFGAGLCQSREERNDGQVNETTIVFDGDNQMRILIAVLQDGRAVAYRRATLTRKP